MTIVTLTIALPHPDVAHEDFHKHIKADFPEPVRMKQLLAWCARRALDEQKAKYASTESANAAAIGIYMMVKADSARVIGEEVLRDLIENRISTSWYHRQVLSVSTSDKQESQDGVSVTSVKKRLHPQNLENLRKIQLCQERLERLDFLFWINL
jgi:kinetochore protein Mis13/DSN1